MYSCRYLFSLGKCFEGKFQKINYQGVSLSNFNHGLGETVLVDQFFVGSNKSRNRSV